MGWGAGKKAGRVSTPGISRKEGRPWGETARAGKAPHVGAVPRVSGSALLLHPLSANPQPDSGLGAGDAKGKARALAQEAPPWQDHRWNERCGSCPTLLEKE